MAPLRWSAPIAFDNERGLALLQRRWSVRLAWNWRLAPQDGQAKAIGRYGAGAIRVRDEGAITCGGSRVARALAGGETYRKRTTEKTGSVQSLRRALSIMKVIAAASDGVTLTEIARATNLASSTVHRLLSTLQQDRFAQFRTDGARWQVGVDAFTVGSAFVGVRDIAKGARPLLRRLMEESGETANLAILNDDMAVYMDQVESRQTMRAICKPGGRAVLHSTSLGKSMLAAMRP